MYNETEGVRFAEVAQGPAIGRASASLTSWQFEAKQ